MSETGAPVAGVSGATSALRGGRSATGHHAALVLCFGKTRHAGS
jgi:hypothetical protein